MTIIVVSAIDGAGQVASAQLQALVTPSGNYPKGVTDKGLQSVWDSKGRKPPAPTAQPLPPTARKSGSFLSFTGNTDMTGFDLRGMSIAVDGNITVALRKSLIRGVAGQLTIAIGDNNGRPNLIIEDCDVDCTGASTQAESAIRHNAGTFNLLNSNLHDAPICYVSKVSPDPFFAIGNYVGQMGLLAPADRHLEHFHLYQGQSIIRRNFFELVRKGGGGLTGHVYPESYSGPLTAEIVENIMMGTKVAGGFYPIQVSRGQAGACTVAISNNVAEPGLNGGFVAKNGAVVVTGSGNVAPDGRALSL